MSYRLACYMGLLLFWSALLCAPAGAQGAWVKYQQTSSKPAFTIEYPSGWAVDTTRIASNYTLGELVFPGKMVVAFETKADTDLLECGVKVYAIPGNVSGSDLLLPLTAVGSSNGMSVSKLHGQDYLQKMDTPTVNGQRRTIWRSFFLGDNNFYMVYMDLPSSLVKQQPASRQYYDSMVRSFTAPDWPVKAAGSVTAASDPIPITVVNAGRQTLHIEINQTGSTNKKDVHPGQIWTVSLTKGGASGYTGFFDKNGQLSNTVVEILADTIDSPATWTFREGSAARKQTKWVRQITPASTAANAQGWLKYVHAAPSFSLDMLGGWTVTGGDQADKIASDKFTLTPQAKVSFDAGVKPNVFHASVTVYTASEKADVPKLQALLAAQHSDGVTAPPVRMMKQLNGHDYLQEASSTITTYTWNSYLPIDNTVYVLTHEGPLTAMTQGQAFYKHMTESFLTNSWQPIQPTTPATPTTTTTRTGTSGK